MEPYGALMEPYGALMEPYGAYGALWSLMEPLWRASENGLRRDSLIVWQFLFFCVLFFMRVLGIQSTV